MENLQQIATNFAKENNIKFQILETSFGKHFATDTFSRSIFKCKLSHGKNSYTFNFGQSMANGSSEPNLYDVLSCLQKYEVGTFYDFCSEFGYDVYRDYGIGYNTTNLRICKNVCREYAGVKRVFSHCLSELQEIR